MEYASVAERTVTVNVTDSDTASVDGRIRQSYLDDREERRSARSFGPDECSPCRLSSPPTSLVTITPTVVGVNPAVVAGNSWTNPDVSVTSSIVLDGTNWMAGLPITVTLYGRHGRGE